MTDIDWLEVAGADRLDIDEVMRVDTAFGPVAIYRISEGYFATQDICTHAVASLAEGYLEDGLIECPLHAGRFCVRTGRARTAPATVALATYPVQVVDRRVLVGLPAQIDGEA